MALFPFFVDIEGKEGLIIGTGKHAQEKIKRLEPYGPKLRIIPEGEFSQKDLESLPAFVIVAGEDVEENHRIAKICRKKRILDNIEEILDFLQGIRPSISKALTDKKQRYKFYYELSEICMRENRPLTEEEFRRQLQWHVQSAKKNLQE